MLVQDYFARSRAEFPSKAAITYRGASVTYEEIGATSDAVTSLLTERGHVHSRIAFWMRRGPDAIAAILGILGTGSAYVPLDPDSPVERLATILNDCEIRALVVDPEKAKQLPKLLDLAKNIKLVLLSGPGPGAAPPGPEVVVISESLGKPIQIPDRVTDADLAYIFYTSGSTGIPKGVMISHLNIVNFVEWARGFFAITPDDHLGNPTPLFFDLSTFDLHVTFASGATLHMISEAELLSPKAILDWIAKTGLTVWFSVPSVLTYLNRMKVLRPGLFPHLRAILWCGEPFPAKDLADWMTILPGKTYANLYGPTETTVASTCHVFNQQPSDLSRPITVGKPCDNTKVLILDENGRTVSVGEIGELCIGGNSVMKGYWRRPEKNAEVFVQNPMQKDYVDLFYRTGDLAVFESDGTITLKGRKDFQIKSRGYRIELGDIESAMVAHPLVDAACAVAYPTEEDFSLNIKVYYSTDGSDIDENALREHVAARLPRYMLPQKLEHLNPMPRLPNGKIDRNACKNRRY